MSKEGEGREVTSVFPVVSLPYLFIASSLWEKPYFVLKNSCLSLMGFMPMFVWKDRHKRRRR